LTVMGATLAAAGSGIDLPAATANVAREMARAFQADECWAYLPGRHRSEPDVAVEKDPQDRHKAFRSVAQSVVKGSKPIYERGQEIVLDGELTQAALLGFPLWTEDRGARRIIGAMVLASRDDACLEHWDNDFLLLLGEQIGLALEKARLQQECDFHAGEAASLLQASSDSIMVIDDQGRIESVNPALEKLLGFSRNDMVGRPYCTLLESRLPDGQQDRGSICPLPGSMPRGSNVLEVSIQTRGGLYNWVEMAQTPIYDSRGRLTGAVLTFRDITDRKESDRLKDDFISLISHEFRSPVTVVMGMASTLLRKEMPLPATARGGLRDILTQAKRLNRLVDNLLAMARSRAGTLELSFEKVRIGKLAAKVIKELQSTGRTCSFVLDFPLDLPPATADPVRLELVLRNLLENAIRYSSEGGMIRIWGRQEDSVLSIGVEDQGTGIAAEHLQDIFRSFYRLQNSGVQDKRGIGLGLAACQRVVEAHGGRIWAESEPGKGSTFAFTLPLQRVSNAI